MKEEWRKIKDFPNYSVSNTGKVRNDKRNKVKVPVKTNTGYAKTDLYKDGKRTCRRTHRLVGEAFIPNPENKPEINHKDGNKLNNNADNLEWVTRSENEKHAFDTGLARITENHHHGRPKGFKNPNAGLPRTKVRIVETGKVYSSVKECARDINGDDRHIHDCLHGRQRTHRGYHFERVENDKKESS